MVIVNIENRIKSYEADIRDLCMAFFPYQKVLAADRTCKICHNDDNKKIYIDVFFYGELTGDRKKDKSEIKRQLYDYLMRKTGKKLLWGTFTGIRPVTIVTDLLEKDQKHINTNISYKGIGLEKEVDKNTYNEIIKDKLRKEYYISDKKVNELIATVKNEIKILNRDNIRDYKDRCSIYIGVPFCKSTCLYCSFTSFNVDKYNDYVNKYLDAFEKQIASYKSECKLEPMTIYIGGGTPTSLSEKDFDRLLSIVDKYVDRKRCIEYTVEAGRPDTITYDKLRIMKEHIVTRISINPQTFNQKTLDLIGRKHRVKDVIEKFNMARTLGFDNINMDIILGLPDEKIYHVAKTLYNLYKLKPDSITVHSLALKRAARLNYEFDSWTKGHYLAGITEMDKSEGDRVIDKMYAMSRFLSKVLSLKPYYLYRQKNMAGNLENIGYAKDGKECIYNIMMMSERHTVHGFGTATSKFVYYENGEKRIENKIGYKSIVDYCNNV